MKKKILITMLFVVMVTCLFAVSVSANETAYINSKGEQVEAGSADIAYELDIQDPYKTDGNCKILAVYLYDSKITKIVIPEIKFTHSNGTVYDLSTYSYCRLASGYSVTLPVYLIEEKGAEAPTSYHTQITELEFHIPILGDGAGNYGNLAGYSALKKLSFFKRAYETQAKGGFVSGCTSLKEVHFYGQNNNITGNFFNGSIEKVVIHRGATGFFQSQVFQSINANGGNPCTVYLNEYMVPKNEADPRLTWNRTNKNLTFVLLADDITGYTAEEIASYQTVWQAGNNKSTSNYAYTATIQTYCDFYAEHISYSEINACVGYCEICTLYDALPNPEHVMAEEYQYENGYTSVGNKHEYCSNEGCAHTVDTELPALFTSKGYSKDTTSSAIVLDIKVDNDAVVAYEQYLKSINEESAILYGIVVAVQATDDKPLNDDATAKNGALVIKFNENNYSNIQIKITGIDESNYETGVYCSGYMYVNNKVTYINGATTGDTATKVTYASLPSEE